MARKQRVSFADKRCVTVLGWHKRLPKEIQIPIHVGYSYAKLSHIPERFKEKEDGSFSITHKENHSQGMRRKALNGKLHVLCNVKQSELCTSKHHNFNSLKSEVPD